MQSFRQILKWIGIPLGILLVIGSYALDAFTLVSLGLPTPVWVIIGLIIFFSSVVSIVISVTKKQQQLDATVQGFIASNVPIETTPTSTSSSTPTASSIEQDRPRQFFHDMQLYINELARNKDTIQDLLFDNCEIIGPAFIHFGKNTRVERCTFSGEIGEVLTEVAEGRRVVGGVAFVNCIFRRCDFKRVGVLVTPPQLEMFKKDMEQVAKTKAIDTG